MIGASLLNIAFFSFCCLLFCICCTHKYFDISHDIVVYIYRLIRLCLHQYFTRGSIYDHPMRSCIKSLFSSIFFPWHERRAVFPRCIVSDSFSRAVRCKSHKDEGKAVMICLQCPSVQSQSHRLSVPVSCILHSAK